MGSSTSVYFGPYVKIKRDALQTKVSVDGCATCNKKARSRFCKECGQKIGKIDLLTSVDMVDIIKSMGRGWNFLCDIDKPSEWQSTLSGYDNDVYTIGIFPGNYVDSYRSVNDLHEMPKVSEEQEAFIKDFNEKFGEGTMTLYYGVIVDYD